ncbi:MAG: inositol monophosphatase [Candidatus Woykebacteria bacterium]
MTKELEVAIKAAKIAGETLEYHFETLLERKQKEDKSLVTKADLEADDIIIKEIKENFPTHAILSEEKGLIDGDEKYLWVIDPLDGTTNFARGIPVFSTSIAFLEEGEAKISVVYNPVTNSLFTAEKDNSAYWNGEKLQVSEISDLSKSLVSIGRARDVENKEKMSGIFNKLYFKISSQRILGSAALELAWVASGRLEGFISVGLQNWDVAGGLLLVSEAGGKITNFNGDSLGKDDKHFVASNGRIHNELLETLKSD